MEIKITDKEKERFVQMQMRAQQLQGELDRIKETIQVVSTTIIERSGHEVGAGWELDLTTGQFRKVSDGVEHTN